MANKTIDYSTEVRRIDGTVGTLADYRGKVLLVVNTASRCGHTWQYDGLEQLHRDYGDKGLVVMGFPCDQFGHQEPGQAGEIAEFCRVRHGVTFPLHDKITVNGRGAHPLFRQLKSAAPGLLGTTSIKWNFTKFLVGRDGVVRERFAPADVPDALRPAIEAALAAPA